MPFKLPILMKMTLLKTIFGSREAIRSHLALTEPTKLDKPAGNDVKN